MYGEWSVGIGVGDDKRGDSWQSVVDVWVQCSHIKIPCSYAIMT